MLRIRATEKRKLENAEREAFIEHVYVILKESWATEVGALGEDGTKSKLRAWLPHLEARGVETEKPLAKALNVFFATESDFKEDPTRADWIGSILDVDGGTETSKTYDLEVALFRRYKHAADTESGDG